MAYNIQRAGFGTIFDTADTIEAARAKVNEWGATAGYTEIDFDYDCDGADAADMALARKDGTITTFTIDRA